VIGRLSEAKEINPKADAERKTFDCVNTSIDLANIHIMAKHRTTRQSDTDANIIPLLSSITDGLNLEVPRVQVDPEAAEEFIAEKRIGERIRYLRLKKSMGLVDLGKHTGLSASFLSQLETGRVVPTLRNLARIAMVFSKDLSYFFDPEPQTLFRVHRQKERVRMPQSGAGEPSYFFESLGYLVPDRQLDPYFAEFLPAKAGRETRAHQHVGCEFLYLLSGKLDVRHGDVVHHVESGDAVYFDANTIHSYVCAGDTPANAVIVTLQHPVALHLGTSGRGTQGSAATRFRNLNTPTVKGPAQDAPMSAKKLQRTQ
jgi:transcriptional regulator with XRE-family HTH domain